MTDKKHIENYTDLSRPLSRVLWDHHKQGTTPSSKISVNDQHFDLDALDKITTKSKLNKSMTLYSGIRHDPSKHMDDTGHVHIPAYTSTSEQYSVAHKFANRQARRSDDGDTKADGHVLRFNMKKGQHAVDISGKSIESHEKERLLPRNIKVNLNHAETNINSEGRKIHVWDAHVVT